MSRLIGKFAFAIAALAALATAPVHAQDAPELRWANSDGEATAAASLALDVDVDVHGLVAEATVRQQFRNDAATFMEGVYLLPLPEGAAVHTLKMKIGARVIEGEIREKAQAQAEYVAAAANGQRASLVEQSRANVFRTVVANVAPGETVEIEVGYWQRVAYRDGVFEWTFPLTFVSPYSQQLGAGTTSAVAPLVDAIGGTLRGGAAPNVTIDVALDPGVPIASVESDTHAVVVKPRGKQYDVSLGSPTIDADRDFVLRWRPQPSREPTAALFVEQTKDAAYALAMFVPPTQAIDPLPRELILVIDTSGSMLGASIEHAKAALDAALAHLKPQDRFNVIEFNSITRTWREAPVDASAQNIADARAWVGALVADGGTEMLPALDRALSNPATPGYVRQVVFATDGAVTNEEGLYTLIEDSLGESRLFPIGIGDAPNAHFIEQAARMGRGVSTVIRDLDEVEASLAALFDKLDRPAMRDLAVTWPGVADAYPRALPDLYHGEPLLVTAKLDRALGKLAVSGLSKAGGWSRAIDLRAHDDRGIARGWAKAKVESLEDDLRRGAEEDLVRAQMLDVALAHSLVTRYTSLVAIDRTKVRAPDATTDTVDFANGGSLAYAQGATTARELALLGLAGLVFALFMLRLPKVRVETLR